MYKRTVAPAPEKAIMDGKIMFGTYNTPFEEVNLADAPKPYKMDLSHAEKMARITHWEAFQIGDERFFVMAVISPPAGFSEVMLYDKVTKKEHILRNLDGPGIATRSALNLMDSTLEQKAPDGNYYSIKNALRDKGTITFTAESPHMSFHFEGNFAGREPIVVLHPFSENRPFYSHKALAPGKGYAVLDGERIEFDEKAYMVVDDHMGYYNHYFWYDWVTAAHYQDGKLVGIQLTTNELLDPFTNNENCVFCDGKMYPLPDVRFYRSRDRTNRWYIKDDLGMVDLVFEPTSFDVGLQARFETHGFFLDFYAPFGYLSGRVNAADGVVASFDKRYCMGESRDCQMLPDEANIDN